MYRLYKFLISKISKLIFLVCLSLVALYWSFNGFSWCQFQAKSKSEQILEELSLKLERSNPEAATELAQLRKLHNENALAAMLQTRFQREGIDGLARLATARNAFDLQLADLAANPEICRNTDERTSFLYAHVDHLNLIDELTNHWSNKQTKELLGHQRQEYLNLLQSATQYPTQWRQVRDNPMMVHLMLNIADQKLLAFYDEEKEWLDDVLFLIRSNVENEENETPNFSYSGISLPLSTASTKDIAIGKILQTIHQNHPHFHDAVQYYVGNSEDDPTTLLLTLYSFFEKHGAAIHLGVSRQNGQIPLEEFLEVMLANIDFCEQYIDSPEQLAAKLIYIRGNMPNVWKHANHPFVLQLSNDAPHHADSLCEKYGTDDIASLIYLLYSDAVPQASAAIDKFGDLAIYILRRYAGSDSFHTYLKSNAIGIRIIPYMAMFEDRGLTQIAKNEAWLDKYFDDNGNPKEMEWWRSLPVGAAVGIVKNMGQGLPSEWSEIGWAAMDVADAGLLVLSLGATAPATVAKTGGSTAVKVGTKQILKETVDTALQSTTRVTAKGSRTLAKTQKKNLIRTGMLGNSTKRLVQPSLKMVGSKFVYVLRATSSAVVYSTQQITKTVYRSAKSIYATWQSVPLNYRRIAYRSLLATGLVMTIMFRTMPALPEALPQLGAQLGKWVSEATKTGAQTVASTLGGILESLLHPMISPSLMPYVVYVVIWLVLILGFVWCSRGFLFQSKRIVRPVN